MTLTLAFRISRDLSYLFCDLHHMSLSTRNSKDTTIVKTCCRHFREEVEMELQKRFGAEFVKEHIRFQLPATDPSNLVISYSPEE